MENENVYTLLTHLTASSIFTMAQFKSVSDLIHPNLLSLQSDGKATAKRYIEDLQKFDAELRAGNLHPVVTPGEGLRCGAYSITEAIAAAESSQCTFKRRAVAHEYYTTLKASLLDNPKAWDAYAASYALKTQGSANFKEFQFQFQNNFYTAQNLVMLITFLEEQLKAPGRFNLVVLYATRMGGTLVYEWAKNLEMSQTATHTLYLRNIDNSHWEPFVPLADDDDVSVNGKTLNVDDVFVQTYDPRFKGKDAQQQGIPVVPKIHARAHANSSKCSTLDMRKLCEMGGPAIVASLTETLDEYLVKLQKEEDLNKAEKAKLTSNITAAHSIGNTPGEVAKSGDKLAASAGNTSSGDAKSKDGEPKGGESEKSQSKKSKSKKSKSSKSESEKNKSEKSECEKDKSGKDKSEKAKSKKSKSEKAKSEKDKPEKDKGNTQTESSADLAMPTGPVESPVASASASTGAGEVEDEPELNTGSEEVGVKEMSVWGVIIKY